jgi:hypothetical protein
MAISQALPSTYIGEITLLTARDPIGTQALSRKSLEDLCRKKVMLVTGSDRSAVSELLRYDASGSQKHSTYTHRGCFVIMLSARKLLFPDAKYRISSSLLSQLVGFL